DEKPTGSKDPYALRRAALGLIRIVLDNEVRLNISFIIKRPLAEIYTKIELDSNPSIVLMRPYAEQSGISDSFRQQYIRRIVDKIREPLTLDSHALDDLGEKRDDLLSFFADRLKVQLREQGARHDLVDAVFALG